MNNNLNNNQFLEEKEHNNETLTLIFMRREWRRGKAALKDGVYLTAGQVDCKASSYFWDEGTIKSSFLHEGG